jgi:hypothetical protein
MMKAKKVSITFSATDENGFTIRKGWESWNIDDAMEKAIKELTEISKTITVIKDDKDD